MGAAKYHIPGEPILPNKEAVEAIFGDLRRLHDDVHREYASNYIADFMVGNKDKETILVPYHPM